ncbi:MAG: hypothetical protein HOL98_05515 [Gammaproteobacteria bacterium]|jgi:hypothetical protein|nr:hypothetical protein [Gammaproteobacteria bacterium]MBT5202898.1 hypothetical protein [Gammaproteobacteria bacterium]MBT5600790.1 hypothetical protein [Gammaproteobacteria bacterium]MBT6244485.1 hypothetical protein [Gammaproteobacteria bacterium]
MNQISLKTTLLFSCFSLMSTAIVAESNVVNLWECNVNDSKTIADVQAANSKWVKYVNANVEGGNIQSYIMTPIVGITETFKYADSYPSLTSWATVNEIDNEEMKAIEQGLNEAATCSSNTLHRSTPS